MKATEAMKSEAQGVPCLKKVLADADLQKQLRALGEKAIRRPENTYATRLESILSWAEQ